MSPIVGLSEIQMDARLNRQDAVRQRSHRCPPHRAGDCSHRHQHQYERHPLHVVCLRKLCANTDVSQRTGSSSCRDASSVSARTKTWLLVITILIAYVAAFGVRLYARGYTMFFRDYVRWLVTPAHASSGPTHVFVLFVDHFEPDYDAARVKRWRVRYEALAARHHDAVGRSPQHTLFYPAEQAQRGIFSELRQLT